MNTITHKVRTDLPLYRSHKLVELANALMRYAREGGAVVTIQL